MDNGIQIRIGDLIFALQKRWKMIVAGTLVGLVLGLMLSAMTFVQSSLQSYQVSGSFSITTQSENGLFVNGFTNAGNNDFHLSEDMVDAVIYVVQSNRIIEEVINDLQLLTTTVEQLQRELTVKQYSGTQIIEMSLVWNQAEDGLSIWNAIVSHASAALPSTLQLGALSVINEPQAEALGIGVAGKAMPVVLSLLGFLCGMGYALMELLMRPTLNNVRDAETLFGLETIGLIPRDDAYFRQRKSLLVADEVGSSEIVQNYSAAAYILRNQLGTKEEHHCFFVTSATKQEGKSTVAANLAIQLSDMGHRTLLIDFDTRNPSLGALFLDKVDYSHSLNAIYRGDSSKDEAVTTLTGYLDLLPTVLEHGAIPMDALVVDLIQQLTQEYEYVVLDTAPVGMVSDPLSLKQVASNVLFVIGYDTSTIPEIQKSLEKLDKSGLRVIGCVVNGVQTTRSRLSSAKDESGKKPKQKKRGTLSLEEAAQAEPREAGEAAAADEAAQTQVNDAQAAEENPAAETQIPEGQLPPPGGADDANDADVMDDTNDADDADIADDADDADDATDADVPEAAGGWLNSKLFLPDDDEEDDDDGSLLIPPVQALKEDEFVHGPDTDEEEFIRDSDPGEDEFIRDSDPDEEEEKDKSAAKAGGKKAKKKKKARRQDSSPDRETEEGSPKPEKGKKKKRKSGKGDA